MPVPRVSLGKFEVSSDTHIFAPAIYPGDIVVSKNRNKVRYDNLCDGETIDDIGSKNREIMVKGLMFRSELQAFDDLLDSGTSFDLLCDEWVGEVEVLDGERKGYGVDMFSFTLNLVSTGKDEYDSVPGEGILDYGYDSGFNGLGDRYGHVTQ